MEGGVLFKSCLCQKCDKKPESERYKRVRAFDTNKE